MMHKDTAGVQDGDRARGKGVKVPKPTDASTRFKLLDRRYFYLINSLDTLASREKYSFRWRTDREALVKDVNSALKSPLFEHAGSDPELGAMQRELQDLNAAIATEEKFNGFMEWLAEKEDLYMKMAEFCVENDIRLENSNSITPGLMGAMERNPRAADFLEFFSGEGNGTNTSTERELFMKWYFKKAQVFLAAQGRIEELERIIDILSSANQQLVNELTEMGYRVEITPINAHLGATADVRILGPGITPIDNEDGDEEVEVTGESRSAAEEDTQPVIRDEPRVVLGPGFTQEELKREGGSPVDRDGGEAVGTREPTQELNESELGVEPVPSWDNLPSWDATPGQQARRVARSIARGVKAIVCHGFLGLGYEMAEPEVPEGKRVLGQGATPEEAEANSRKWAEYDAKCYEYGRGYNRAARALRQSVGMRVRRIGARIRKSWESTQFSFKRTGTIVLGTVLATGVIAIGAGYALKLNQQRVRQQELESRIAASSEAIYDRIEKSELGGSRPANIRAEVEPEEKPMDVDAERLSFFRSTPNLMDFRGIYESTKSMDSPRGRFVRLAHLSGQIAKNPSWAAGSLSRSLVIDILADTLDEGTSLAGTTRSKSEREEALEVARVASGTLGADGSFGGKSPSEGQKKKVDEVRVRLQGVLLNAPDEAVAREEAPPAAPPEPEEESSPSGGSGSKPAPLPGSPTRDTYSGVAAFPVTSAASPAANKPMVENIGVVDDELTRKVFDKYGLSMNLKEGGPKKIFNEARGVEDKLERFVLLKYAAEQAMKNPALLGSRAVGWEIILSAIQTGYYVYNTPKYYEEERGGSEGSRWSTLVDLQEGLITKVEESGRELDGKEMAGYKEGARRAIKYQVNGANVGELTGLLGKGGKITQYERYEILKKLIALEIARREVKIKDEGYSRAGEGPR